VVKVTSVAHATQVILHNQVNKDLVVQVVKVTSVAHATQVILHNQVNKDLVVLSMIMPLAQVTSVVQAQTDKNLVAQTDKNLVAQMMAMDLDLIQ
jgi:hypothetical protein